MNCRHCGRRIPEDAVYCPFCGKMTESHLRVEDSIEDDIENEEEYEYEEPRGKRWLKTLISIITAIVFVAAAFMVVMHFAKDYLGEEPWGDKKDSAAQTEEAEEQSEYPKPMYVTAEDGLFLRKGPGQDNEEIHILNYGQEIQVEKIEDGWAYTTADGVSGWCSAEYLTENKEDIKEKTADAKSESDADKGRLVEPSVRIESGYHGTVNAEGGLNLRCGPGEEYDILLVIPYEAEVAEEGREGDWIFVSHDGQYGWVNSGFITPIQ